MRRTRRQNLAYAALLAGAFLLAVSLSWIFGAQIDNYMYDAMLRHNPPAWHTESVILALDERTLNTFGGIRGIRKALARGLELLASARPKAVAVDIDLAD